jgi:UPF0755 protein
MVDLAPDAGAETAPAPPPQKQARWGLRVLLAILVVLVVALASGGLWLKGKLDPSGPPGEAVAVEVIRGSSTSDIAEQLADAGVVTDARLFRLYLRYRNAQGFQAGQYELQRNSSMGEALDVLLAGPALAPATNVTIPEGLTVAEIAERVRPVLHLDPQRFVDVAQSGIIRSKYQPEGSTTLEGLLFPETYRVGTGEDEAVVVQRMIEQFEETADGLGFADAAQRVGVSPYEAIIVASLIEAEAKSDEDRGKIARVIYNRLAEGMPLGIDATFYYELGPDRKGTALRRSELDRDGPYNTRLRKGLVPTPIMAPGRESLAAALDPDDGPWLYYVLKDDTTHAFTDDYDQFLRDKAAAQANGLIP